MRKEYRRKSLPFKIILLFLFMALVLDIGITFVSSAVYSNKITEEYERVYVGVSGAVASNVNNGRHVEEWLNGEEQEEYRITEEKFINIIRSYSDIQSIRVCKMNNNGMQNIFSVDKSMKNGGFKREQEYDDYLLEKRDALLAGESIDVLNGEKDGNHFMAVLTPIKDSKNKVVAYAICEISSKNIELSKFDFAKKVFVAMGIVSVILVLTMSLYINRKIIYPLGKIDKKLRMFAGDANTGEEIKEDLSKIKVKGNDEISRMHNGFIKLIDEVSMKSNEVKEFDAEIIRRLNEAVKDEE